MNEKFFINQSDKTPLEETNNISEKGLRTKKEAQQELFDRFGLKKTSDFQSALQRGDIGLAEKWLDYIIENRESFPQYAATWSSWLGDRQRDIEFYKTLKENIPLEQLPCRTKEEAQADLQARFGFYDTKGFRQALKENADVAKEWLDYIIANKMAFPQYLASWDNWLADRQRELNGEK